MKLLSMKPPPMTLPSMKLPPMTPGTNPTPTSDESA